ncbi:MAG: hypothetical protein GX066_01725 [Clostridiaceae bacterium]|nr:hypothetical protein [Clostridiaceae bacterium]
MLCQKCQQRLANVHVTRIINNEKIEMHLCEKCARENENIMYNNMYNNPFDFTSPFSINNFISAFLGSKTGHEAKFRNNTNVSFCRVCGTTYDQFARSGQLGCANCYNVFQNELEPVFKRIHGNTYHRGKMPHRTGGEIKAKREINRLKSLLDEAIKKEEYEKAAKLRDQINDLKAYLEGRG